MFAVVVLFVIIAFMGIALALSGSSGDETNAYYTQQQKRYADEMYRRNRTRGPYA